MLRPMVGFKRINCECFATNNSTGIGKISQFARWDGNPKRKPLKGEYYISGAFPVAYIAIQDMTTDYFIAIIA